MNGPPRWQIEKKRVEEREAALLALPVFSLVRISVGKITANGKIYYRLPAGLGPIQRDVPPREILRLAVSPWAEDWHFEILASPETGS